jgi:hypothetical protein
MRRAMAQECARAALGIRPGARLTREQRQQLAEQDAVRAFNHHINTVVECTKCRVPGTQEAPFHVCTECTHPEVVAVRREVTDSIPALARTIAYKAALACERHPQEAEAQARAAERGEGAREAAQRTDWAQPEGKYVLFHLLTVSTWPARVAHDPHHLAAVLGRAFDVTAKPHRTRAIANAMVLWAGPRLRRLFDAWHGAGPLGQGAEENDIA